MSCFFESITATLEPIPEETESDLQDSEFLVEVFNSKDLQLAQAGKEAAYYLQQDYYLQQAANDTPQPIEQQAEQDRFRPDRLVYPEIPIYDINLAPHHYHLLCSNRSTKLPDDHFLCLPDPEWADIELAYSKGQHAAYYDKEYFYSHFDWISSWIYSCNNGYRWCFYSCTCDDLYY